MQPIQQLSPVGKSIIESFIRQRTRTPDQFHRAISPEDEMYLFHVSDAPNGDVDDWCLNYFESGALMIEELRPVFERLFGGFDQVGSLLEFACGHGRFTRHLIQELPPEKITVSDIYADAVSFQKNEFGVNGQVSATEPRDYHDENRYDCILVCSLFSHLPERTFQLWLERLLSLLTEDGVLIFTVHDEAVGPSTSKTPGPNIQFIPESESRSLDKNVYGTTFVNEEFCQQAIRKAAHGSVHYARLPKALWRFQDIYAVSHGNEERLKSLKPERGLEGYIDRCQSIAGQTYFSGWAYDFRWNEKVDLIEILEDGERIQVCIPSTERTDVAAHFGNSAMTGCGWVCMVEDSRLKPESIISVQFTSSTGERHVAAFDSLGKLRKSLIS